MVHTHQRPTPSSLPRAYYLFASRRDAGICCAVRQDRTGPSFLTNGAWEFQERITDPVQAPADLNLRVAQASMDLTGYHLFVRLRASSMIRAPDDGSERIITVGEIIPYFVILYGLTIVIALAACF